MGKKWRGWRFHRASDAEKRLALLGVPSDMWKPLQTPPKFEEFSTKIGPKKVRIGVDSQSSWYAKLRDGHEELHRGYLIGIGSENDDRVALHAAVDLIRLSLEEDPTTSSVKIVDCGGIPPKNHTFLDNVESEAKRWWAELDSARVIIIHNVLAESATDERVQSVRDILRRCGEATRILVVAGASPVGFMVDDLCMTPDIALYVGSPIRRVVH